MVPRPLLLCLPHACVHPAFLSHEPLTEVLGDSAPCTAGVCSNESSGGALCKEAAGPRLRIPVWPAQHLWRELSAMHGSHPEHRVPVPTGLGTGEVTSSCF